MMKIHFHVVALVLLLASALPAQLVGSPYYCCSPGQQTSGLLIFGDPNVSTSPAPFLTAITPIHQSTSGWLMISEAEDSTPWPLDPSAGWLLVNPAPTYYLGTMPMTQLSGVHWTYQWILPADPALAGTLLFFQSAKTDPAGWVLSNGWTVQLQ
jgi:hypothetical protein